MKKLFALALAATLTLTLFCSCGSGGSTSTAESGAPADSGTSAAAPAGATADVSGNEFSFAFCNVAAPDNPQNVAYREAAASINEKSGGAITMNIYDNAQMGNIIELMQGVIDGTFEMVVVSMPTICSFDEGLMVNDLPYLWPSAEVACSVINDRSNGIADAEMANLESKGAHFLGVSDNGFMVVANSVREITCPADMQGLKIRVPEAETEQAFMEACGAIPTIMPSNEVYTSLQTNVVDGHDFDAILTLAGGYDEVTKYLTETNHIFKLCGYFVNANWWNSLDERDRAFLESEFQTMLANSDKYCAEATATAVQDMRDSGMIVTELTEEAQAEFEEIGRGLWEQFYDRIDQDLLAKIQEEIAKYE